MSVISSRDPMMTATTATLTRPGSRASDTRPIFLLERCLAIRFERIHTSVAPPIAALPPINKKPESRPGSSLSQLSSWLPWQRHSNNTPPPASSCVSSERSTVRPEVLLPANSIVKDSSAPAGWVYDGGFVLYQVSFFFSLSFLIYSVYFSLCSVGPVKDDNHQNYWRLVFVYTLSTRFTLSIPSMEWLKFSVELFSPGRVHQ